MWVCHCLARLYLRGIRPRDYMPDFAALNAQSTSHGARPGPKLAPVVRAGLLRAPVPRAREKPRGRKRNKTPTCKKKHILIHKVRQGSPSGCGRFEIPGVSQVAKGNTGAPPMYMSLQYVKFDDDAVPLLLLVYRCLMCCAGAFAIQRKCGMESFSLTKLCSGWHAHTRV